MITHVAHRLKREACGLTALAALVSGASIVNCSSSHDDSNKGICTTCTGSDNPGGSGRFKQITNDWQSVNVVNMKGWMTSSKGPPEDPSWSIENPYQWPRDASHPLGVALTEAFVRANPPLF